MYVGPRIQHCKCFWTVDFLIITTASLFDFFLYTYLCSRRITDRAVVASSPVVGSSRNNTAGDTIISMAMLVRFLCPPDMPRINWVPIYVWHWEFLLKQLYDIPLEIILHTFVFYKISMDVGSREHPQFLILSYFIKYVPIIYVVYFQYWLVTREYMCFTKL